MRHSRKKEILIVDDQKSVRKIINKRLSQAGYSVTEAVNGVEALELLQRHIPALIILDISMPRKDGFQTCQEIKANPPLAGIPIIFLSAVDDVDSKIKGLNLGSVDYLVKPIDSRELIVRIKKILKEAETKIRLAAQLKESEAEIEVREAVAELSRQELIEAQEELKAREAVAELARQELMEVKKEIKARESVAELSRQELIESDLKQKKILEEKITAVERLKKKLKTLKDRA